MGNRFFLLESKVETGQDIAAEFRKLSDEVKGLPSVQQARHTVISFLRRPEVTEILSRTRVGWMEKDLRHAYDVEAVSTFLTNTSRYLEKEELVKLSWKEMAKMGVGQEPPSESDHSTWWEALAEDEREAALRNTNLNPGSAKDYGNQGWDDLPANIRTRIMQGPVSETEAPTGDVTTGASQYDVIKDVEEVVRGAVGDVFYGGESGAELEVRLKGVSSPVKVETWEPGYVNLWAEYDVVEDPMAPSPRDGYGRELAVRRAHWEGLRDDVDEAVADALEPKIRKALGEHFPGAQVSVSFADRKLEVEVSPKTMSEIDVKRMTSSADPGDKGKGKEGKENVKKSAREIARDMPADKKLKEKGGDDDLARQWSEMSEHQRFAALQNAGFPPARARGIARLAWEGLDDSIKKDVEWVLGAPPEHLPKKEEANAVHEVNAILKKYFQEDEAEEIIATLRKLGPRVDVDDVAEVMDIFAGNLRAAGEIAEDLYRVIQHHEGDEHFLAPMMPMGIATAGGAEESKDAGEDEEEVDEEIGSKLEETLKNMADMQAAQAWSTPGDEEIMKHGRDVWIVAHFGTDGVAVNGDPVLKGPAPKHPKGYELTRDGGDIPTTEEEVSLEHAIDHVAREMKVPVERVNKVAKSLGYTDRMAYLDVSGETEVWAPAAGATEDDKPQDSRFFTQDEVRRAAKRKYEDRDLDDPRKGWDRFKALEGHGTWDEVVEAGVGNPTKEEEHAITSLGYYGETITKETIKGLKDGKRFSPKTPYSMRIRHPNEPDVTEKFFTNKDALVKAAHAQGGGEAGPRDTSWINDIGSRVEITGATYGDVFPAQSEGHVAATQKDVLESLREIGGLMKTTPVIGKQTEGFPGQTPVTGHVEAWHAVFGKDGKEEFVRVPEASDAVAAEREARKSLPKDWEGAELVDVYAE